MGVDMVQQFVLGNTRADQQPFLGAAQGIDDVLEEFPVEMGMTGADHASLVAFGAFASIGFKIARFIFETVRGYYVLTLPGSLALGEKIRIEINRPGKLFASTLPLE